MNMYYHSFIMGFNWWYIVLPIMYFAIGYVGYKIGAKLTVNKHLEGVVNITVRSISADRAWATLAATLVTALVVKESSRGLIQLFDNSLSSGESGVWSIIAAGATIGFLWLVLMMAYQSAFARGKACKVNDYRHQLRAARVAYKVQIRKDIPARMQDVLHAIRQQHSDKKAQQRAEKDA